MPTVSVFFRVEDLEKWKGIQNKSQWLHDKLNEGGAVQNKSSITAQEWIEAEEKQDYATGQEEPPTEWDAEGNPIDYS